MLRADPLANPEPLIRRVYAFVAYRLGDGPDAEDVTSETFERALRYRESYDRRKGEPLTWLIGIARRCIDDGLALALTIGLLAALAPVGGATYAGSAAANLVRAAAHAVVPTSTAGKAAKNSPARDQYKKPKKKKKKKAKKHKKKSSSAGVRARR